MTKCNVNAMNEYAYIHSFHKHLYKQGHAEVPFSEAQQTIKDWKCTVLTVLQLVLSRKNSVSQDSATATPYSKYNITRR